MRTPFLWNVSLVNVQLSICSSLRTSLRWVASSFDQIMLVPMHFTFFSGDSWTMPEAKGIIRTTTGSDGNKLNVVSGGCVPRPVSGVKTSKFKSWGVFQFILLSHVQNIRGYCDSVSVDLTFQISISKMCIDYFLLYCAQSGICFLPLTPLSFFFFFLFVCSRIMQSNSLKTSSTMLKIPSK